MWSPWRVGRRPLRELVRGLVDLVLPAGCAACGVAAAELCPPCRRNLQWRRPPACARCGEPALADGGGCGSDHAELRHLSRLVAPLRYAGTGGALVRRFKLDADPAAAAWLLRAMAGAWRGVADVRWRRACLVPVPLHARRRRERGFDQAAWLALGLQRRLWLPAEVGALVRRLDTLPQGDPRVMSRQGNVAAAFAVHRPLPLRGRRVILVDDVFTSGATARACARLLREAGTDEVAVLTACRS
jgi:ComF family protein